jgi:hypothetical protein
MRQRGLRQVQAEAAAWNLASLRQLAHDSQAHWISQRREYFMQFRRWTLCHSVSLERVTIESRFHLCCRATHEACETGPNFGTGFRFDVARTSELLYTRCIGGLEPGWRGAPKAAAG